MGATPGPDDAARRRGRDRRLAARGWAWNVSTCCSSIGGTTANDGYLDALNHLADLQQEGKIRHLALTNFDTERLSVIADHGIRVVSNQVQYSLVDRRPEVRMAAFCC